MQRGSRPEFNRDTLLDTLRKKGIHNERVLQAMARVPREEFVPDSLRHRAWEDTSLPITHEQTISQPFVVAWMTELLRLPADARVLEIGTGSGYQAAVLAALPAEVFTIERIAELSTRAQEVHRRLGLENIHYRVGDGTQGWAEEAPFDGIIVTAGSPDVPRRLPEQLRVGARLVIPVGSSDVQEMRVVERTRHGYRTTSEGGVRFVKLIGQHGWEG